MTTKLTDRRRKEGDVLDNRITNGKQQYQIGAEIGRGGFGLVFQALNVEMGDFVAVKRFPLNAIDAESLSSIEAEIELMKKLNHPNIVKYVDTIRTQDFLYIVLEYMENGSLQHVIKKFGSFSESLTAIYITQVLRGLKYLHEQGVLHRDIKGANILTTKDGQVKLADFGVAMKLSDAQGTDERDVVGTPYWMAPEIIEMSTPTAACDVWSVGCTIVELVTGKPPYFDLAPMAALFRIVQDDYPPLPDGISQALREFLLLCFHKEPGLRSTASKLLEHPWLQNPSSHLSRTSELLSTKADPASMDEETQGIVNTVKLFRKDVSTKIDRTDSSLVINNSNTSVSQRSLLRDTSKAASPTTNIPFSSALQQSIRNIEDVSADWSDDEKKEKKTETTAESIDAVDAKPISVSQSVSSTAKINVAPTSVKPNNAQKQQNDEEEEDWDADFNDETPNSGKAGDGQLSAKDSVLKKGMLNSSATPSVKKSPPRNLHRLTIESTDDISNFIATGGESQSPFNASLSSNLKDDKGNAVKSTDKQPIGRKHIRNNTHVNVGGLLSGLSKYQDKDDDDVGMALELGSPKAVLTTSGSAAKTKGEAPLELKRRDLQAQSEILDNDFDELFQLEDSDFVQNENKDVHIKRSKEIIHLMGEVKIDSVNDVVVQVCCQILKLFDDFPEQREHIITHYGVLPILNMLELSTGGHYNIDINSARNSNQSNTGAETSVLRRPYVLRVINKIVEGSVRAQEQLSLVGVIPVVMKLLEHSVEETVLDGNLDGIEPIAMESARFVHQISSTSSLTLQMLIGAGGLPVLVHMIGFSSKMVKRTELISLNVSFESFSENLRSRYLSLPKNKVAVPVNAVSKNTPGPHGGILSATSEDARRMVYMGVDCITQVFSVQSSRTRDFCLLFVKMGLLSHLSVALWNIMSFDRNLLNVPDPGEKDGSGATSALVPLPVSFKAEELQCIYAKRIAHILWNFSRYEVADYMSKGGVLVVLMKTLQSPSLRDNTAGNIYFGKQVMNPTTSQIYTETVELLLKCIKNLSMEPTASALNDLENVGAIPTLTELLNGPLRERAKNHVVPTLFNLCRINKRRQEQAAVHGAITHLQRLVKEESHLKQFALPILCDLAHTSAAARAELWKTDGVVLYISLLSEKYWQSQSLGSLHVWLQHDTAAVEAILTEPRNLSRLIDFFRTATPQIISGLHKPLLDMMTKSKVLSRALAISGLYVSALVRRLDGKEAAVLRSLLRMLQLLHQHHPFPRQFVLDHNLYAIVREFAQDEKQVLVSQMANRLLRDIQTTTVS